MDNAAVMDVAHALRNVTCHLQDDVHAWLAVRAQEAAAVNGLCQGAAVTQLLHIIEAGTR